MLNEKAHDKPKTKKGLTNGWDIKKPTINFVKRLFLLKLAFCQFCNMEKSHLSYVWDVVQTFEDSKAKTKIIER